VVWPDVWRVKETLGGLKKPVLGLPFEGLSELVAFVEERWSGAKPVRDGSVGDGVRGAWGKAYDGRVVIEMSRKGVERIDQVVGEADES
jgi:hypothetical protein